MEPHQQQQQQQPNEDGGSSTGKGGNFLCRQSSTRWTPTTDQIRILKDLYYNSGVRSPTAEEIQRISARLRQYGKIEGKNVFYWFQNHKARERQKKRLNADVPMQRSNVSTPAWKSQDNNNNNSFPKYSSNYNNPAGMYASSSSSAGFITVGQMSDYGYGSVPMEKGFRECSLSAGGNLGNGGGPTISNNFGWVGIDPYASHYTLFDKINPNNEEDQEEEKAAEIETLPLFPMHNEGGINSFCSSKPADTTTTTDHHGYYTSWYRSSTTSDDVNGNSLELSLNSYSYMGHSSDYL